MNKRNWQLMCVATSCVTPSNSRVAKYLTSHLRKCSLDTTTEEGKFARYCNKVQIRFVLIGNFHSLLSIRAAFLKWNLSI